MHHSAFTRSNGIIGYALIRKKSFDGGRFLNEQWVVIVDGTQLFCFKKRHCEHCLTKTFNKGTEEEKTIYYHQVLEAKLVLNDDIIVSIATEFIENPEKNPTKQDCELNSFKRLSETPKKCSRDCRYVYLQTVYTQVKRFLTYAEKTNGNS